MEFKACEYHRRPAIEAGANMRIISEILTPQFAPITIANHTPTPIVFDALCTYAWLL